MNPHESMINGYNTLRQHALEVIVVAGGFLAVGNAVQPDLAHASHNIKEVGIAKGGEELSKSKSAIPAWFPEYMNDPNNNPYTKYGGRAQAINASVLEGISTIEAAQETINDETKSCQDWLTNFANGGDQYGVGRQEIVYKLGSKGFNVISDIYDDEQYVLASPRQAQWLGDCEDFTKREIEIQPIIKKGNKVKEDGEPVVLVNNDSIFYDKYVLERKRMKAKLEFNNKVTEKDKRKRSKGYKTTVRTEVREPYPGQAVVATNSPKSRSWNTWIGKKRK